MSGEEELWAVGLICLAAVLITICITVALNDYANNKIAFENDYERVQSYGNATERWVKVRL